MCSFWSECGRQAQKLEQLVMFIHVLFLCATVWQFYEQSIAYTELYSLNPWGPKQKNKPRKNSLTCREMQKLFMQTCTENILIGNKTIWKDSYTPIVQCNIVIWSGNLVLRHNKSA